MPSILSSSVRTSVPVISGPWVLMAFVSWEPGEEDGDGNDERCCEHTGGD